MKSNHNLIEGLAFALEEEHKQRTGHDHTDPIRRAGCKVCCHLHIVMTDIENNFNEMLELQQKAAATAAKEKRENEEI